MADYIIKPDNKKTVVGIDVGGSTTKIVGFAPGGKLLSPIFVQATDPVTSIYGAFGRFTLENGLSLDEIDRIARSVPANATVLEIRPPRFRYSNVSTNATMMIFSFSSSKVPAICAALIPWSSSRKASSTKMPLPIAALPLSTT